MDHRASIVLTALGFVLAGCGEPRLPPGPAGADQAPAPAATRDVGSSSPDEPAPDPSVAVVEAPKAVPIEGSWERARPEMVSSERDAYLVLPDGRVAHRTADDPSWEWLSPLPRCGSGRRYGGSEIGVADDGTPWVGHHSCISWWDGAWHTEDLVASVEAVTTVGNEVVVVATVRDGSNQDIRVLHGGRDGWRLLRLTRERSPNAFFLESLVARAPDDIVLLATAREAVNRSNSFRFDGARWRRANDLGDAPSSVHRLSDGRLFVVGEEGVYEGWPGEWSEVTGLPAEFSSGTMVGEPHDCWLVTSRWTKGGTEPTGMTRWKDGVAGTTLEYPARGGARFAGATYAWSDHDVVQLVDEHPVPVELPPRPDAWPSPTEAEALRVAPELELPGRYASLQRTLQSRTASVVVGRARHALVARGADPPSSQCTMGLSWWLVRVEDGATTHERELGMISCADREPLVEPQLEHVDFDDDGRPELLLRIPAGAATGRLRNGMKLVVQVVVDARDHRTEGAWVIGADYEPSLVDPGTRLLTAHSREGATLHREAFAWGRARSRARAPKLAPCTHDASTDTWTCAGPSLETELFGRAGEEAPLVLPVPQPRGP